MTTLTAVLVTTIEQLDVARARLRDVLTLSTDVEAEARLSKQTRPLSITEHERQILVLLSQGLSNKEIATQIGRREKAVANRLTTIYRKLGVSDRTQAALLAHDLELVPQRAAHLRAYAPKLKRGDLRTGPRSRLGGHTQ